MWAFATEVVDPVEDCVGVVFPFSEMENLDGSSGWVVCESSGCRMGVVVDSRIVCWTVC